MQLRPLTEFLKALPQNAVVKNGFGHAHSYRGYYDQIAFTPVPEARIGDMVRFAEEALGAVYTGYKGGSYTMREYTECWIAEWGDTVDYPIHPLEMATWAEQAR